MSTTSAETRITVQKTSLQNQVDWEHPERTPAAYKAFKAAVNDLSWLKLLQSLFDRILKS
jgi:hypothetical protein